MYNVGDLVVVNVKHFRGFSKYFNDGELDYLETAVGVIKSIKNEKHYIVKFNSTTFTRVNNIYAEYELLPYQYNNVIDF